MGVFDHILKDNESLFKNELALDYTFIPPIVQFREQQQQYIASCIKPLFQKRSGKTLLITGSPGIGKTVAVKHLLKELSDETEEILPLYINCWKKNTTHKITLELCELLDIKFIQNLTSEQIFKRVASVLSKKPVVIVLDEIDKLENEDILYNLSEDIFKKTIILITNDAQWLSKMDQRIKSRLMPELLSFNPYSMKETYEILKQRVNYAFHDNVFSLSFLDEVAEKSFEKKDIRTGIYLLKESGLIAEEHSSKKILQEHVKKALSKLEDFQVRDSKELTDDIKELLELVKSNQNKTAKQIHELSKSDSSYRTFKRKLDDLEKSGLIKLELKTEGQGRTTIVKLPQDSTLDNYT